MTEFELRKNIYDAYNDSNSFEDFISIIFPAWRNDIDQNNIDNMRDYYYESKHSEKMVIDVRENAFNSVSDDSNDNTRWDIKQWQSFNNLVNDVINCYEVIYDVIIDRDQEENLKHYR